jgi:hypothetical protein
MSDSPSKKDRKFMAVWICFGVAIGCGIGFAIGNPALGIGPGGRNWSCDRRLNFEVPALNFHILTVKQFCRSAQT